MILSSLFFHILLLLLLPSFSFSMANGEFDCTSLQFNSTLAFPICALSLSPSDAHSDRGALFRLAARLSCNFIEIAIVAQFTLVTM